MKMSICISFIATWTSCTDDFIQRFFLDDFVVVADAGFMSKRNVKLLEDAGYKYIIGARIHTESEQIKEWILRQDKIPGKFHEHRYGDNARLILGYSVERVKKDAHNREKKVSRLRKATNTFPKLTNISSKPPCKIDFHVSVILFPHLRIRKRLI